MSPSVEFPFRLAAGLFWAASFLIRIVYQSRMRGTRSALSVHQRGAKLYFRLYAFCYVLLLLAIVTPVLDFALLTLPDALRWYGGAGCLTAYLLLFWRSHAALGRNWSGMLEIHTDHRLVVTGPFRYIRHPMYASFILSGIGFLLLTANAAAGGGCLLVVIAMYLDRVGPEEAMMRDRFGGEYDAYMKRTGRIFPRLF